MNCNLEKEYYKFWGKSGVPLCHLLAYHGLDVSSVARQWTNCQPGFMNNLAKETSLPCDLLGNLFLFFAALHDAGKFSITFQNCRPDLLEKLQDKQSGKKYTTRHDQLGWMLWNERLSCNLLNRVVSLFSLEDPENSRVRKFFDVFANMAFGHHGLPPKSDGKIHSELFLASDYEAAERYMDDLLSLFGLCESSLKPITDLARQDKTTWKAALANLKFRSWQMAGAMVLCDWIASGGIFPLQEKEEPLSDYYQKSLMTAEGAFKNIGLYAAKPSVKSGFRTLFPVFAKCPTPLQAFCDQVELDGGPQLWILEDVTGAGKTEAACTLVSRFINEGHVSGAFVSLPTMATANAMYERMTRVYRSFFASEDRPSLVLSHGARYLSDTFSASYRDIRAEETGDVEVEGAVDADGDTTPSCSEWLADSTKKALLADVGIGTLDQVLLGALPVRFQSLRMLGMSAKVLVVDEVHAYDPYMLRVFEKVIAHQAKIGSPVILLSATLPHKILNQLCEAFYRGLGIDDEVRIPEESSFPRVTRADSQAREVRQWHVDPRPESVRSVPVTFLQSEEDVYRQIREAHDAGRAVCWIRNTVKDVIKAHSELKESIPADLLMVFHSRFTLADRIEIEKQVLSCFGKESRGEDRSGRVLIASQVVEQSLDLDFDVLISDLAPIDLIVQRAGRLHRHLRNVHGDPASTPSEASREKPVFYVHIPRETDSPTATWYSDAFPAASYVYNNTKQLWQTKEILKQEGQIALPERARVLIEAVYGENSLNAPDVFDLSQDEAVAESMVQRDFADFNQIHFTKGYDRQSSNRWDVEERVPTRLGDKQRKLYLSRLVDGELCPYYQEPFGWDLSMVKVRADSVSGEVPYDQPIEEAINELKKTKRIDRDDLILVVESEQFSWELRSPEGKSHQIQYQSDLGLQVVFSEKES